MDNSVWIAGERGKERGLNGNGKNTVSFFFKVIQTKENDSPNF